MSGAENMHGYFGDGPAVPDGAAGAESPVLSAEERAAIEAYMTGAGDEMAMTALPDDGPDQATQAALDHVIRKFKETGYRPHILTQGTVLDVAQEMVQTLSSGLPEAYARQRDMVLNYLIRGRLVSYCRHTHCTGVSARLDWLAEPATDAPGIEGNDFYVEVLTETNDQGAKVREFNQKYGQIKERHFTMDGSGVQQQDMAGYHALGITLHFLFALGTVQADDAMPVDQRLDLALLQALGADINAAPALVAAVKEVMEDGGDLSPEALAHMQELMAEIVTLKRLTEIAAMPDAPEGVRKALVESLDRLAGLLETGLQNRLVPASFAAFTLDTIKQTAAQFALAEIMPALVEIMDSLSVRVETAAAVEQVARAVETLIAEQGETLPPEQLEALEALIEELGDLDGPALRDRLVEIGTALEALSLPAEVTVPLRAAVTTVIDMVEAQLPAVPDITEPASGHEPAALEAAAALVELLAAFDDLEAQDLPPELRAVLEALEAESPAAEQIADILAGQGEPVLAAIVQELIVTLNDPAVARALPQDMLNVVNQTLQAHAETLAPVVVTAVIANLQTALEDLEPGAAEAVQLQEIIEALESGGDLAAIEPQVLETLVSALGEAPPPALLAAVETITVMQAGNAMLSNDTLAVMITVTDDLEAVVALLEEAETLTPEQADMAAALTAIIETLADNPESLQALQQLAKLETLLQDPGLAVVLPAAAFEALQTAIEPVEAVMSLHETALAVKHDVEVPVLQQAVTVLAALEVMEPAVLEAAGVDLAALQSVLETDIGSQAALGEIVTLQVALAADAPPALQTALVALLETQIETVAAQTGVTELAVKETAALSAALTELAAGNPEIAAALEAAGVDPAVLVVALGTPDGAIDAIRLADMIKADPALADSLPPSVSAAVETVMTTHIEAAAVAVQADPAIVRSAAELVIGLGDMPPEVTQVLAEQGLDTGAIAEILKAEPASLEAALEIAKIEAVLADPATPPEVVTALTGSFGDKLVAMRTLQVETIAATQSLDVAAVSAVIETMTALEAAPAAVKAALAERGVDIAALAETIKADPASVDSAVAVAKLEAVLNDPAVPEPVKQALQDTISPAVATVTAAQGEAVAQTLNITPAEARTIVETAAILDNLPEAVTKELAAQGADIAVIVKAISSEPASVETAVRIATLETVIADPATSEIVKQALTETLAAAREPLQQALAREYRLEPAAMAAVVEAVRSLETLPAATQETLSEAGIAVTDIVETIKADPASVDSAVAVARLEAVLADPAVPETVKQALQDTVGPSIETVRVAQGAVFEQETALPAAVVREVVESLTQIDTPAVRAVIDEAGLAGRDLTAVLTASPDDVQAVATLTAIQAALSEAAPAVSATLETALAVRVEQIAEARNVEPALVRESLQVIAALETAAPVLEQAGLDVGVIQAASMPEAPVTELAAAIRQLEAATPAAAAVLAQAGADFAAAEQAVTHAAAEAGIPREVFVETMAAVAGIQAAIPPALAETAARLVQEIQEQPAIAGQEAVRQAVAQLTEATATTTAATPEAVQQALAVVTLAAHAAEPSPQPLSFAPQAVSQQLSLQAQASKAEQAVLPPGNKDLVKAEALQGAARIIEGFAGTEKPPVAAIVTVAQKLDTAIARETNPARAAELMVIQQRVTETLPPQMREALAPALTPETKTAGVAAAVNTSTPTTTGPGNVVALPVGAAGPENNVLQPAAKPEAKPAGPGCGGKTCGACGACFNKEAQAQAKDKAREVGVAMAAGFKGFTIEQAASASAAPAAVAQPVQPPSTTPVQPARNEPAAQPAAASAAQPVTVAPRAVDSGGAQIVVMNSLGQGTDNTAQPPRPEIKPAAEAGCGGKTCRACGACFNPAAQATSLDVAKKVGAEMAGGFSTFTLDEAASAGATGQTQPAAMTTGSGVIDYTSTVISMPSVTAYQPPETPTVTVSDPVIGEPGCGGKTCGACGACFNPAAQATSLDVARTVGQEMAAGFVDFSLGGEESEAGSDEPGTKITVQRLNAA